MAEALQEELLAVPGIAGAEVESDEGVAGVRVQLAVGADAETVGAEVRRILAQHGMRPLPDESGEHGVDGPPPPPGAPGSVVSFPLVGEHAVRSDDAPATDGGAKASLEGVAVEETPAGISVLVRLSDGRRAERILDDSGLVGLDEAILRAEAELLDRQHVSLVQVSEATLGEHKVVTVLVTVEDRSLTGATIQRGGRAYAVARAFWTALDSGQ